MIRLEIAHHGGIRVRAGDGADAIKRVGDIGDPVAQRLVHGVFQRLRTRLDGANLGAEHLHAQHVRLLPLDVDRAHIDDAGQAELGAQRGGGDAMHAGAGLGDDAVLAHAQRQHDLAEHIVHLVRAGVVELLALEIDFGAAAMLRQPLGEIKRRRPPDIGREMAVHLLLEFRIGLGFARRPSPDRGSAASASRRRSGRHRCRNARARRGRCGRNWAAARSCAVTALAAESCDFGLARGADEGADLVRVFFAGRALDAGGDIDARRAGDGNRLGDIVRRRARPRA